MNLEMLEILTQKKGEIGEHIYKNLNFFFELSRFGKKDEFFESLSKWSNVPKRKILGWYYYKHLPHLNEKDVTMLCSSLHINFDEFISIDIGIKNIISDKINSFVPSEVAKRNILKMMIQNDINDSQKFESKFESNFSSNYYYVLHRKNKHQRNISWDFLIIAAHVFRCSVGDFFL